MSYLPSFPIDISPSWASLLSISNQQLESSQYLLILVCSLSHLTRGSVGLLSWMTAGVFVLCWSILLSPICCSSLAWKQDQERFHTYTHWPLINKSDQGPFPHIHTVPMKRKTIQTRAHTVQSRKYPRANFNRAKPHLWSQRIRPGNPDSDPSKQPFGMSEWFFFYTWSDDCSLVAPSQNTRRLVPISCSLFFPLGLNRQVLLCKFVI